MEIVQRRRARLRCALLACWLWSCSARELPRTEVMVVVDTDLELGGEIDTLRIEVSAPGEATRSASATLAAASALPQTLGLVHERGALGPIHVLALGLLGDQEVIRREAELSFIVDKTLSLPMHLVRACVARSCGGAQTCSEHGCVASAVDATRLAEWHDPPPTLAEPDEPPPDPEEAGVPDAGEEMDGDAPEPDANEPDATEADADTSEPDAREPEDTGTEQDGAMCTPQVESCNEVDDDCDGVIDNGYDLLTDTRHCGVCNEMCRQPTAICCKGTCSRNCAN